MSGDGSILVIYSPVHLPLGLVLAVLVEHVVEFLRGMSAPTPISNASLQPEYSQLWSQHTFGRVTLGTTVTFRGEGASLLSDMSPLA
jgi:hypothetical protein